MYYFWKSYYFPIQKTFSHGTCIELWVTLSPLVQKNLWCFAAILGYSRDTGKQVLPHVFSLITQLKTFSLLPSSDNTSLCSQIWNLHLLHHLPPSLQGLEEGGCGTAGAGQPSHPILVGTETISPTLTGLWGAASETWQTGTASPTASHASIAAGRQNASEVCTAAPSLNNVHLCRWSPHSHPSTTLLPKGQSHSLGAGHNCSPNSSRRVLPFLSEGLNKVSGKTTDDSRSFG